MTNKELRTHITKELKEKGFKQRTDYTLSIKDYGYANTSIKVRVKNPKIDKREIEAILIKYQDVDYDERTQEILQGCNTFVEVRYEYGIFDEVAQEWATTARGLMNSKEETTRIFDGLILLDYEHKGKLEIRQQDKNYYGGRYVNDFKDLCIYLYKFAKFGSIAV